MTKRKYVKYNNSIEVAYLDHLDGGGSGFGQQYIPVVKEKMGKVGHVFEFCSGPGFIGFSLLANNLCERLTLADINPEAVEVCKETIKSNNLESKVSVYTSDSLDNIPETEQWDLVVGNPPHWFSADGNQYKKDIRVFDPNFRIHQKFYRDIRKFLKPSGSVLLQENKEATSVEDFRGMIEKNGLKIVEVFSMVPTKSKKSALLPRFNLELFYKIFNPRKIFQYFKITKRRILFPQRFYFIWCKLK
ncbi:MAG TPA: methyltransferase [Candidatus Paceibacterota bacterium]|nr:methyltransferase [Candidatus Paceibacterota bacterium]